MYRPPPTDALIVNSFTGKTRPVPKDDVNALVLFSSAADVVKIETLLKTTPGVASFVIFDGANGPFPAGDIGGYCPQMIYGKDGRKVNALFVTMDSGLTFVDCVGIIIARQFWGSAWNEGRQGPYEALYVDTIASESLTEINWGPARHK